MTITAAGSRWNESGWRWRPERDGCILKCNPLCVCVRVTIAVAAITSGTQAPSTTDYAISVFGPSPVHSLSFFLLWFPPFTRINIIYIVVSSHVAPQNIPRNIVFNATLNCGVRVFVYGCTYVTWKDARWCVLNDQPVL